MDNQHLYVGEAMRSILHAEARAAYTPFSTHVQTNIMQRKCNKCRKKKPLLQRSAAEQAGPSVVPPIVHDVLNSPGQPLDSETRAFFEPRFGHNFGRMHVHSIAPQASRSDLRVGPPDDSYEKEADQVADRIIKMPLSREQNRPKEASFDLSRVRLHTDARAALSAEAIGAQAFTVGQDIVFGAAQYQPGTKGGMRLMAHELVHFMQQSERIPKGSIQREDISGEGEPVAEDISGEGLAGETKVCENPINLPLNASSQGPFLKYDDLKSKSFNTDLFSDLEIHAKAQYANKSHDTYKDREYFGVHLKECGLWDSEVDSKIDNIGKDINLNVNIGRPPFYKSRINYLVIKNSSTDHPIYVDYEVSGK
jgi:hypothetical protein